MKSEWKEGKEMLGKGGLTGADENTCGVVRGMGVFPRIRSRVVGTWMIARAR